MYSDAVTSRRRKTRRRHQGVAAGRRHALGRTPRSPTRSKALLPLQAATTAVEAVLHSRTDGTKVWKHLPLVLAAAFLARAAVALSGDFALHPRGSCQGWSPAC